LTYELQLHKSGLTVDKMPDEVDWDATAIGSPSLFHAVVIPEAGLWMGVTHFSLDCGQDLSIGYIGHDADRVRLYFEESFSFRVLEPDAAVALNVDA
jgi:uncharacterized linocin/CFP29 family protein